MIKTSFAAGELAPSIFARTDLAAYHQGAATMRNFFVDYRSGASTRAGTKFVIQAFKSATAVRLIPFVYSTVTTYVIEFGDLYCRFINNGAAVLETGFAISAISQALPGIATVVGNNFSTGDWVFITGVGGMTQVNGRYFEVTVAGNSVTLNDVNGNPIDSTAYGAYTAGGTISRVYKITSPYAAADLALLKFSQSASVMTITHPSYAPRTLTFVAATNWAFATITFGATVNPPVMTGASVSGGSGATANYSYVVTSVDANGQESGPSTPQVLNGAANINSAAGTVTVTWNAATGAVSYNVYRAQIAIGGAVPSGAAFGLVGFTTGTSFADSGIPPNFSLTPPIAENPFSSNNPGVNCFFQQRQYYAASTLDPTTFWGSVPGAYTNFNVSDPVQDNDAITGTLVSLQVNAIKFMLPMPGGLVLGTSTGAWTLSSGGSANATTAVTPTNATATPQAYNGTSDVPPIVVNYDILYVQAKGAIVRDLSYNIYAAIYTGTDISIRSNHLFFGHQILQWAYAEEPFKVIWAVRDDGIMLSLTFMKEQEIAGWARHDTNGLFQSVAVVTEGQVDAPYFVVKRLINGVWVQFIERMMERQFAYSTEDTWAVDAGVQSSLPTPSATLNASAASGTATFTASASVFTVSGQVIRMGGGVATITQVLSTTQAIATITQAITTVIPETGIPAPAASGAWSLSTPSTVFTGLDYLNGQTVSILADGGVIAPQVVANNSITLAQPATKVTAGLGYQAQLQTMPLDTGEPTSQGKRKKVGALNLKVASSLGLKAGRTFGTVTPIKTLTPSTQLGQPQMLLNGDARIVMDPLWDVPGQVCLQMDDPLPASVLGVIPEIVIGDTK